MAHLVPIPAPSGYQVPTLTNFTVLATGMGLNGIAVVQAWGIPANASNAQYKVLLVSGSPDGFDRTESDISPGEKPDLVKFTVAGLREGDSIAAFQQVNFGKNDPSGKPLDENWVRCTGAVKVHIAVDTSAAVLAAGKLPTYAGNANISFYSYGSMQRLPPLNEDDWKKSVIATLDTICSNPLGKAIVKLVPAGTVIHPWTSCALNANSEVNFSPQDWRGAAPGEFADEVLLHELIHVIENNADNYVDASGFFFDKTDFLTINGTNVYSCLLGRGLRKDHHGSDFLPQPYFDNPKKHFTEFGANYGRAKTNAAALCAALKAGSNRWNPFIY